MPLNHKKKKREQKIEKDRKGIDNEKKKKKSPKSRKNL